MKREFDRNLNIGAVKWIAMLFESPDSSNPASWHPLQVDTYPITSYRTI
jgi:hypothetical protein